MSQRHDAQDLMHAVAHYGNLQWHLGYLSRRTHDTPPGPAGDAAGAAQLDAEAEVDAARLAWAVPLVDLLTLDGATEEQRRGVVGAIDAWASALWSVGWWEAQPHPEGELKANPLEEYQSTEIRAAREVWQAALGALIERHGEPTAPQAAQ